MNKEYCNRLVAKMAQEAVKPKPVWTSQVVFYREIMKKIDSIEILIRTNYLMSGVIIGYFLYLTTGHEGIMAFMIIFYSGVFSLTVIDWFKNES
jgi:hypothetical protein